MISPRSAPGEVIAVKVGQFIRCTAEGRPDPAYTWTRLQGVGPITGMYVHVGLLGVDVDNRDPYHAVSFFCFTT